jgi:hypothetical protein
MIEHSRDPDTCGAMRREAEAALGRAGASAGGYRTQELSGFIQWAMEWNWPPSPRRVIYGRSGLLVRMNADRLSVALATLATMVGRHTGGISVTVTSPGPDRAKVQFHEARFVSPIAGAARAMMAEGQDRVSGNVGGDGLSRISYGLAFAERVACEHGGAVTVDFTGGKGLSATLLLPLFHRRADSEGDVA